MKREVIIDIAQSYVSRLYEENEYPNDKREIEIDVEEAFIDGANWRINSVWNDSSITPDPMQECLVLLNDPMRKGFHIGRIENQGTNNGKWNIYGYFTPSLHEFVIRWAYIKDLI
jgi:hypothetical protein